MEGVLDTSGGLSGLGSFGFLAPPQTESTGKPLVTDTSVLPGWAQTTLGLFGGTVGALANGYSLYQASKNPKPLSADYEAEMRAREAYNVPRQLGVPTWMLLAGVVGVVVLVIALKD